MGDLWGAASTGGEVGFHQSKGGEPGKGLKGSPGKQGRWRK